MESKKSNVKLFKIKEEHLKLGGKIAAAVILLVLLLYVVNFFGWFSSNKSDWGAFGDYFGGVLNPLLSFMAFIALLYTIKIQQDALSITHEELELTREELGKSTEALEAQSESLKLQNFETTFFNLLNFHSQQMNIINIEQSTNPRTRFRGGDVFKYLYESHIKNYMNRNQEKDFKTLLTHVNNNLKHHYGLQLDNFFNQVITIFNLINANSIFDNPKSLKADYFNILKMQYSTYHLSLIYIHLCNNSHPEYYEPLRESEFFKEINKGDMPGLFSYLRDKYGTSSKEGLMNLIIDYNDESSEKCK